MNVFFDVQGTLLSGNVPRPCVREVFLELAARGHDVYLWSNAGASYAAQAARILDVEDLVIACWAKNPPPPVIVDYVVDDHRDFAELHGGYAISAFGGDPEDRELWGVAEKLSG